MTAPAPGTTFDKPPEMRQDAGRYRARDVALAFLAFCEEHGDLLANLKLQKLLYYAQGWYLAFHDRTLFDEALEAWIHGPVVPEVYREFLRFGTGPVRVEPSPVLQSFDKDLLEHVKDVWEAYGSLTSYDLERLSHKEPPWLQARAGLEPDAPSTCVLDLNVMQRFFKEVLRDG